MTKERCPYHGEECLTAYVWDEISNTLRVMDLSMDVTFGWEHQSLVHVGVTESRSDRNHLGLEMLARSPDVAKFNFILWAQKHAPYYVKMLKSMEFDV